MTEKLTSLTRRVLLGLAAIAPFALLGGRSRRARAQPTCQYPDGDFFKKPEAQEAGKLLWKAFEDGMDDMRWFFTTDLEPGLQEDRTAHHGQILCRNWEEYLQDPAATEKCCRMAGRVAEVLRSGEGTDKVTKPQFLAAAEAIKIWQREKALAEERREPGGGAC
jgi:hypothetical protein